MMNSLNPEQEYLEREKTTLKSELYRLLESRVSDWEHKHTLHATDGEATQLSNLYTTLTSSSESNFSSLKAGLCLICPKVQD